MKLLDWCLVAAGVILSSLGSIFLKLGAERIDHSAGLVNAVIQALMEWRLYLGAACYFIPVVIWVYMLKKIDITFLQPLFALVYVVTPLLAIFWLHESVPIARWLGVVVIMVGIGIVARS